MEYRFKVAQLSLKRLFVSWQFADNFNQSPKPLSSIRRAVQFSPAPGFPLMNAAGIP
jgi:hypothetical protein